MWVYIVRRLLYTPLIVVGVLLVTFTLFNLVQGDISAQIAGKNASPQVIAEIRHEYGWDKPLFFNPGQMKESGIRGLFDSQFFNHFYNAIRFDFGRNLAKQKVSTLITQGAGPSLSLMLPMFFGLLVTSISVSLFIAHKRGTWADTSLVVLCVIGMSMPALAVIIYCQYFFAYELGWFPIHGYTSGIGGAKYFVLPVLIGVVMGLGGDVRFYRTVMLDEIHADYIRTAYAKGVSTRRVLFVHLLKNAMIPIITTVVLSIPFLFLGSLLLERFFGIPGLGYLMVEAIGSRDFQVINAMTYIYALLFIFGQLLTDICYAIVDPRVSLN